MKLSEFKFDLPNSLIASHPAENRDEARMMVVHKSTGKIEHKIFKDIVSYFDEGDILVGNDTMVFPARLYGRKEKTGAKIEEEKRMRFSGQEFYLKSREEMEKLFIEVPESVTNTQLVAEMCDLAIPFPKGSERYPKYPLPPEIKTDRAGYLPEERVVAATR